MDWVDEEKEHIVSRSVLYGGHGKRALQEYTNIFILVIMILKCQLY